MWHIILLKEPPALQYTRKKKNTKKKTMQTVLRECFVYKIYNQQDFASDFAMLEQKIRIEF